MTLPEPSQIEFSGDSRNNRGRPDSSTYPLPPRHSSASPTTTAERLQTQNFAAATASRRNARSPASTAAASRSASVVAASTSSCRSASTARIAGWSISSAPNARR